MPSWARQIFENNGLSIAKGEVPGYSFRHITGYNPDVDSGASETVWPAGGLYPWGTLTSAYVLTVVSTSALDTGSVVVTGLDANYEEITEEINFNGLTSGTGTQEFLRINSAYYKNGDGTNVGNITITADGTTVAYIATGLGQDLSGIYTVPANKTAYITTGDFSIQKGEDSQIRFLVRNFGESFRIVHIGEAYQSVYNYQFAVPLPITEKSDIEVRSSLVETNNTRVTCNFDLIIIENDKLRS